MTRCTEATWKLSAGRWTRRGWIGSFSSRQGCRGSSPRSRPPAPPTASQCSTLRLQDIPGVEVSDIELQRSGPTLTVETLRELRESLSDQVEMVFILGLDVLARFDQWVEPEGVVVLARILAVSRPGYEGFDWAGFYARNPYARGRVDCVDSTAIDISASDLRQRLAAGAPVDGLLPPTVERYIRENGLYTA